MSAFGLIGFPLSHSFSKKYFTERFQKEGLQHCSYENFPIPTIGDLPALLRKRPDLEGLNVTIPYKEAVLPFLSEKNEVVAETGACNCIRIRGGKCSGFNTDVIGFENSLKKHLRPIHRKAMILGTGGAAKAVAYVLGRSGIEYVYVSRKNAQQEPNVVSYENINDDLIAEHLLIINTTPLGMYPDTEQAPPLNYNRLSRQHYLFDLTYNPAKTLFLRNGEARGASIQNGFDMLIIQAEESWKIWNER